jgi:hypothetical protein
VPKKLFLHLLILILQLRGRLNFTQMGRYGVYNEVTYRENFKKHFDFQLFNRTLYKTQVRVILLLPLTPAISRKVVQKLLE